jgi:hypothetical protein
MSPKEQRQRKWEVHVSDFNSSGLNMTHWCSANHVDLEQMKYWTRKFKKESTVATRSSTLTFVPLAAIEPVSQTFTPSLVVQVGLASIELQPGFDPQLLREAVEALSRSC